VRVESKPGLSDVSGRSRSTGKGSGQPEGLDVLLERVLGSLGAGARLAECRALLAWPEVVGPVLAEHAHPLRVVNGRMEVAVPSAVWRNQLSFMQRDLVARLNRQVGADVITDVLLVNRQ